MSGSFEDWVSDDGSGHRQRRWRTDIETFAVVGIRTVDCVIHNVSPSGAQIELSGDEPVGVGERIRLEMLEFGWLDTIVQNVEGPRIGVQFILDEREMVELARFMVSIRIPRESPRQDVGRPAELRVAGDALVCTVDNISPTGASVTLPGVPEFTEAENVDLMLPGHSSIAAIVRRVDGSNCGLMFLVRFAGSLD